MSKTTKLTPTQKAQFQEFLQKWIEIFLSQPADRMRMERVIKRLYALVKLREPRFIWLPCPMSAWLSAICYAVIMARSRLDGSLVDLNINVREAIHGAVQDIVGGALQESVGGALYGTVDTAVSIFDPVQHSVAARECPVDSIVDEVVGQAVSGTAQTTIASIVRSAIDRVIDGGVKSAARIPHGPSQRGALFRALHDTYFTLDAANLFVFAAMEDYCNQVLGVPIDSQHRDLFGFAATMDFFVQIEEAFLDRSRRDRPEANERYLPGAYGYYWSFIDVCFASEHPTRVNYDSEGLLHCAVGQSISYESGWGLWHWHGVRVPQDVIERPETITFAAIEAETDDEIRSVMIERLRFGA
jgi:Domain of unknown function (DUF6745)